MIGALRAGRQTAIPVIQMDAWMFRRNNPDIDPETLAAYLSARAAPGSDDADGEAGQSPAPPTCRLDELILEAPAHCVRTAFRTLLHRDPTPAEQRHHQARIEQGGSRLLFVLRLRYGREGRAAGVRLTGFRQRFAAGLGTRLRRYPVAAFCLDWLGGLGRAVRMPSDVARLQRELRALEAQCNRLASRLDRFESGAAHALPADPGAGSDHAAPPRLQACSDNRVRAGADTAKPLVVVAGGDAHAALLPALAAAAHKRLGREPEWWQLADASAADRHAALSAADALLSLADDEGASAWIRDAIAVDCPVIAVAGGAAEALLGEAGLIVERPHADDLAAAVQAIDGLPELRRRLLHAQRRRQAVLAPDAKASAAIAVDGPHSGSYSLARVNRMLAGALRATGTACHMQDAASTEGASGSMRAEVVLQNTWPPVVDRLRGPTAGLAAYNWEETAFPRDRIARFNARLNIVTTASEWVTRTLQDNGLTVPVETIGLGTEHALAVAAESMPAEPGPGFRFLHVSSGLPRKGLDVLLVAWVKAFSQDDDVRLIIKTVPNRHHDAAAEVEAWHRRHPHAAPVEVYNADWTEGALRTLYESCQVLVAPSRGEGFGLPMAEAMHHGLAVITTAWGGQCDFCTEETAWLIDYHLAPARSHMGLPGSAWAEPDGEHLAARLREVHALTPAARWERTAAGAALLREHFTWPQVAARLQAALARHARAPLVPPRRRIAWVSTWNSRCGIAEYARMQLGAMCDVDPIILANRDAKPETADGPEVERCWRADGRDNLTGLLSAIERAQPDAVVIQFHFSRFALPPLGRLLTELRMRGTPAVVVMHATRTADGNDLDGREGHLAPAERLLVHGVADLERLRRHGLHQRAAILPQGVAPASADLPAPAGSEVLDADPVLASFGFLLPHKGLAELIEAFGRLQAAHPRLRLLLLNASYPSADSTRERKRCEALVAQLPDPARVHLITDFLEPDAVLAWLQRASLIVFPYQHTAESASAAVRMALAADRPVACTPLPIFDDLGAAVHRLPGLDAAALARGLDPLLADPDARHACDVARRDWLAHHAWPRVSAQLRGILEGCIQRARADHGPGNDPGGAGE